MASLTSEPDGPAIEAGGSMRPPALDSGPAWERYFLPPPPLATMQMSMNVRFLAVSITGA